MKAPVFVGRWAVAMVGAMLLAGWGSPAEAKRKRAVPAAEELARVVGTKATFSPKLLSQLKPGMTPKQVKALFPKLGAVSVYGYAKARVKGYKAVQEVRFRFDKADDDDGKRTKLRRATVVYKGWLRNRVEFFDRMMALARAKWGEPSAPGQVERKIITWSNDAKSRVVQFTRIGDRYELSLGFIK